MLHLFLWHSIRPFPTTVSLSLLDSHSQRVSREEWTKDEDNKEGRRGTVHYHLGIPWTGWCWWLRNIPLKLNPKYQYKDSFSQWLSWGRQQSECDCSDWVVLICFSQQVSTSQKPHFSWHGCWEWGRRVQRWSAHSHSPVLQSVAWALWLQQHFRNWQKGSFLAVIWGDKDHHQIPGQP